MECNIRRLADMLNDLANEHGDNATVYIGYRDGSGTPYPTYLIGEDTIDGINTRLFTIGNREADMNDNELSLAVDDRPYLLEN